MLKIALAQTTCEKGALEANLAVTLSAIRAVAARGVDIIGFPEASLTGYVTLASHPSSVVELTSSLVQRLVAGTRGTDTTALVGLVEAQPRGLPYLTQLVVRNGELLGWYRKRTIDDDERQNYAAGEASPVFHHDDIPFGIAICADLGNETVYADAARQGARIVFELAAPGLYGDQSTRDWQSGFAWWQGECLKYLPGYCRAFGIWTAVATQAGRTSDEDFPGGGYLFNPNGERRFATPDWSPGVAIVEIDLNTADVRPFT